MAAVHAAAFSPCSRIAWLVIAKQIIVGIESGGARGNGRFKAAG